MKCLAVFIASPAYRRAPQEYQRAIVEGVFALARREAKFGVIGG